MKTILPVSIAGIGTLTLALILPPHAVAESAGTGSSFKGPVGIQLYSLRDQFKTNVTGTLDLVKSWGIKNVELAGTYGLTPEKFKAELDARGLKAVSGHFGYDRYQNDVEGIAREAKALGLEYVGCAWIAHEGDFDEKECRDAIAVFNKAGETLAKQGLKFFYHTHGYEFQPFGDGTLFDLMMKETNPKFVNYQMDVFWIVFPGQDPAKLITRYGPRWVSTHLKDMKKGTPTGLLTGHADPAACVALGTGMIDFPPLLRAAQQAGVKYHFLEDESPSVVQQVPVSLKYLETVKLSP